MIIETESPSKQGTATASFPAAAATAAGDDDDDNNDVVVVRVRYVCKRGKGTMFELDRQQQSCW
jgi:hypothetical protein